MGMDDRKDYFWELSFNGDDTSSVFAHVNQTLK
jgi:hypothetical protein